MYVLYVDESKGKTYFVLGGIAVHESRLKQAQRDLDAIQARYFPGKDVEFHARKLLGPSGHFHKMETSDREELIREIVALVLQVTAGDEGAAFAVAVQNAYNTGPLAFAYARLCTAFDIFLKRQNDNNRRNSGILILDEAPHKSVLEAATRNYQRVGTPWRDLPEPRPLHYVAGLPLFTDSRNTRLLQVADFIAHVTLRRYERGQNTVADLLLPAFDRHRGDLHGLVHWHDAYLECTCPACVSTRQRQYRRRRGWGRGKSGRRTSRGRTK